MENDEKDSVEDAVENAVEAENEDEDEVDDVCGVGETDAGEPTRIDQVENGTAGNVDGTSEDVSGAESVTEGN